MTDLVSASKTTDTNSFQPFHSGATVWAELCLSEGHVSSEGTRPEHRVNFRVWWVSARHSFFQVFHSVSLRHVLQVDIDLPENKRKDFQPNPNPFASVQRDTFCLTSEMFFLRYYTPSEFPISHSRMKFSAWEMPAAGTAGKCVMGWTRLGRRAALQSLLYCLSVPELQKQTT